MPSFASSAAELRLLARQWREGQRAFRDLFDVLPKREGQLYSDVVRKPGADPSHQIAYATCNEQWIQSESRRLMTGARRHIRDRKAAGASREELRSLRRSAKERRASAERALVVRGGMLGGIKHASKPSEASKTKNYIILCLGAYLTEE